MWFASCPGYFLESGADIFRAFLTLIHTGRAEGNAFSDVTVPGVDQ